MKILHVCHNFYPCVGGVEKYIEGLCKNLIVLGHQSDVACLDTCTYGDKKLPEFQEHKGIKIYRVPYLDLGIYKIAPGVLRFVKNYDIIHVHGIGFFSDFLTLTKFFHRKPLALSGHGGVFHTKSHNLIKKIYFFLWSRLTTKFFKVLVHSKNDEALFSRIADCEFISYAVDVDDLLELERIPEKNSFLYVGRISKNKGISDLIGTMSILKKDVPDLRLYVVGEDWEGIKENLEELARKLELGDNVVFTGRVDVQELREYFAKSQIFVFGSRYEAFGISVIEAMAAGMPVVANKIDSFRNILDDGKNGFLIDFSDHRTAAALLFDLLGKDLSDVSKAARDTSTEYGWKNIAGKMEDVYDKILRY